MIFHNTFIANGSAGTWAPLWQNSQIVNHLFMGTGERGRMLASGTLTPQTSRMDFNGWRWFEGEGGQSVLWHFPEPVAGPGNMRKKTRSEWPYRSWEQFVQHTGHEKHGVLLDFDIFQRFEKPSGENTPLPKLDLRLRDGSKAIDAGEALPNLNDGFRGKAPDLGAIESEEALPHYGPREK